MAVLTGGGKCILGCGRTCALHSKTGICTTCLSALSRSRGKPASWRVKYRENINLRLARLDEVKQYPKGYAVLGGREHGKRN